MKEVIIKLSESDLKDSRYELSTYRKGILDEIQARCVAMSRGKGETILFIEEKGCYAIVREL